MVRQFLRRMFAGRKHSEEHEDIADEYRDEWTEERERAREAERDMAIEEAPSIMPEAVQGEAVQPRIYMITRDKIEHHNYKQITRLVGDILQEAEEGRCRRGCLQLRLAPELWEEADEFFGKRIGKYIEGAERETYDASAFFDWTDEETARIYHTYVMPANLEKQRAFVQSRLVMIYDTCEALQWDARRIAGAFAEAIGWPFDEADIITFERWLDEMSQRLAEEEQDAQQEEVMPEPQEEEDFSYITPVQISREEVEREDITKLATFFDGILSDGAKIREKKGGLVFSFYGFSGELEDVMQDDAVNAWASRLVEQYPYVFYFLNDQYVPMTQFVTSMVVTSWMEDDEVVYDEEELEEFIRFIRGALSQLAERSGESPQQIVYEFERKLFQS